MTTEENRAEAFFLERADRVVARKIKKIKGAISTARVPANNSQRGGNAYRNTRTGYRADLDLVVRSSWEANVARVMMSYDIDFEFEPYIFYYPIKRGNKAYTPDFYLPATEEWIEVKGYFDNNSRIKMRRFKKYFPQDFERLTMIISKSSKLAVETCKELGVPNVIYYEEIGAAFKATTNNWEGR